MTSQSDKAISDALKTISTGFNVAFDNSDLVVTVNEPAFQVGNVKKAFTVKFSSSDGTSQITVFIGPRAFSYRAPSVAKFTKITSEAFATGDAGQAKSKLCGTDRPSLIKTVPLVGPLESLYVEWQYKSSGFFKLEYRKSSSSPSASSALIGNNC